MTSARTSKPPAGRAATAPAVSSGRTRPEETAGAGHVAPDVLTAVRAVLNGPPQGCVSVDERPGEAAYDAGPRLR
ncbi:hypothetical protein OG272_21060 [Streptomyces sp. NBC_00104]|uniref:hypothetical protein n=1 Tax=Streptomyces sp. NBC_00104 TaxID=2903621 RepID=UPI00324D0663